MSIETREITKFYGEQKVLDNINISIAKGEIVGLLGPNGAGKSTLMKIITCFLPPSSGIALVNGHNVSLDPEAVKPLVGYLPENNPLYLDMYVKEYLGFMANLHKIGAKAPARIREIIEITGLGPEQHKKLGMLSKGFRQRAGLAQALLHDPEVLILDEPTSGLDPNQLIGIRQLIRDTGQNKTVLLSTHIMQEVEAVCSRAIIIHQGRIVADSQIADLEKLQGVHYVIVGFDKEVKRQDLASLPGVSRLQELGNHRWRLESKAGMDVRPALNAYASAHGIALLSLKSGGDNLEEIFQQLTTNQ